MAKKKGIIYFVGAGPGDAGLLTLRGKELLERADVVIHDWLVSEGVLAFAEKARKIDAGKSPSARSKKPSQKEQERINRLLLKYAREGKTIVRLKGGDPLVFARGAEEAVLARRHGIPFEFVPGVSAGTAVPAYAGIPLTDRKASSSVVFVTAHETPSKPKSSVDWKHLAGFAGTLVFFMGVKKLGMITEALKKAGKPEDTLVSVIEWGTFPQQRVVEGDLRSIAGKVKRAVIGSPSIILVGAVNAFREKLAWFENKPLYGKTVLIMRSRRQSGRLRQKLEKEGARVLEIHALEVLPPPDAKPLEKALRQLSGYHWVVFTSVNAVDSVFRLLEKIGKDSRAFSGVRIAAVGGATREALVSHGLKADLVPDSFHSRSLLKTLRKQGRLRGARLLLPRTDIAPDYLKKELTRLGAAVDEVTAYRTRLDRGQAGELKRRLRGESIDFIVLTSSSTADFLFRVCGGGPLIPRRTKLVSIGPMTSKTARCYARRRIWEAEEQTLSGVVETLVRASRGRTARSRR